MAMDDRKQRVLDAIVLLYGSGGEPIGSGLLADYFGQSVSSATLRNEMAALTKLGLLEQPHTSAGRVPSAKGYRDYLDRLLSHGVDPLGAGDRQQIDALFAEMDMEPDHLAQSAARTLSSITGLAAAATTPNAEDQCIAHYEVVQVGRNAAAVLAVTNAGGVRTRVARTQGNLTRADAQEAARFLNENLTFRSAPDLSARYRQQLVQAAGEELAPVVAAAILLLSARPSVYLEGAQNLVRWPETRVELADLLALFAREDTARQAIAPMGGRITVTLGEDLESPMPGLCVVSKNYLAGGGQTGTMAVIGPKRMDFRRVIPVLDYFAVKLGQCMSGKG